MTALNERIEKPIRIQRKRTKGWKMPENTVSVCRPSVWGNPFKIADKVTAEMAVQLYKDWLVMSTVGNLIADYAPVALRGKNLACFCKLGEPCHADVLLELANE